MPQTLDISPTIGHAVLLTQLGVGATPGYDAIDIRRMCQVAHQVGGLTQEGAHDYTGWKVSAHTPNSLTVDIAANVGLATVQGDAVPGQGLYVVAPHSVVANLDVTTAHGSLPRLDQIIMRVYDSTHDGLGSNKATLVVLTGTATAGATLDNRNGAAAMPDSAIPLADVLVGAGVTQIAPANIRDRRPFARMMTVTSIPYNANDHQEIQYLADSTAGVVWKFRYRSGSASNYKWEFVGGPSMSDFVVTSEQRSADTWGALTTPGPQLTIPFNGDYDIEIGAKMLTADGTNFVDMSFSIGGSTASTDADAMIMYDGSSGQAGAGSHCSKRKRKTGLAASAAIVALYKSGFNNHNAQFADRIMNITPVRVGP